MGLTAEPPPPLAQQRARHPSLPPSQMGWAAPPLPSSSAIGAITRPAGRVRPRPPQAARTATLERRFCSVSGMPSLSNVRRSSGSTSSIDCFFASDLGSL